MCSKETGALLPIRHKLCAKLKTLREFLPLSWRSIDSNLLSKERKACGRAVNLTLKWLIRVIKPNLITRIWEITCYSRLCLRLWLHFTVEKSKLPTRKCSRKKSRFAVFETLENKSKNSRDWERAKKMVILSTRLRRLRKVFIHFLMHKKMVTGNKRERKKSSLSCRRLWGV